VERSGGSRAEAENTSAGLAAAWCEAAAIIAAAKPAQPPDLLFIILLLEGGGGVRSHRSAMERNGTRPDRSGTATAGTKRMERSGETSPVEAEQEQRSAANLFNRSSALSALAERV